MEIENIIEVVATDVVEPDKEFKEEIVYQLKRALASEFIAWYQYRIVSDFAAGSQRVNVVELFLKNAEDELNDHASKLMNRINELGGDISEVSNFHQWSELSPCKYIEPKLPYNVKQLVQDNIDSEKCAIDFYRSLVDLTRGKDYNTYTVLKGILIDEEQHLADLIDFSNDFSAE